MRQSQPPRFTKAQAPRVHVKHATLVPSPLEVTANNPQTTLVRDLLPDDSSFELTDGGNFASGGTFSIIIDGEIIRVGARDGNWCSTLVRGDEFTGRASHAAGATVTQIVTSRSIRQLITDATTKTSGRTLIYRNTVGGPASAASINVVTRNVTGQSGAIFQTDYDEYELSLSGFVPTVTTASITLRFSTDGGTSFDSGSNYVYAFEEATGTPFQAPGGSTGTTQIALLFNIAFVTVPATSGNGTFILREPLSISTWKSITGYSCSHQSDGNFYTFNSAGMYRSLSAVNAFQLLASSGNIGRGTIRIYGLAK